MSDICYETDCEDTPEPGSQFCSRHQRKPSLLAAAEVMQERSSGLFESFSNADKLRLMAGGAVEATPKRPPLPPQEALTAACFLMLKLRAPDPQRFSWRAGGAEDGQVQLTLLVAPYQSSGTTAWQEAAKSQATTLSLAWLAMFQQLAAGLPATYEQLYQLADIGTQVEDHLGTPAASTEPAS